MDTVGKKALKAGTWYTICTFVLKGLSFITMPIFARIMTKTDVGAYSNLISWIAILSPVLTLDLNLRTRSTSSCLRSFWPEP